MRPARLASLVAVIALASPLLGSCSSGPSPTPVAAGYLTDWQAGRVDAAAARTDDPGAAIAVLSSVTKDLRVTRTVLHLGQVSTNGDRATAAFTATVTLAGLGDWRYTGSLPLTRAGQSWRVHWSPGDVHPKLQAGQHFDRTRELPLRAPLLGATGEPLVQSSDVVVVGIEPAAVTNRSALLATLHDALGIDAAALASRLNAAAPTDFVPVITLRRPDYEKVRAQIHGLPGTRFQESTKVLTPTPGFAAALLGSVGRATAQSLTSAGPLTEPTDDVGLSGLQLAFQRQLAGSPSGSVLTEDAKGKTVATVYRFPGAPGRPVRTTIDMRVQTAAERALDDSGLSQSNAALVAAIPSSGRLVAVANRPSDGYDRALEGTYPPGSTFKVVTSYALLSRGLTPATPVACPPTATADGRTFHNFQGEAKPGQVPFATDFAESCNTAFIGLSTGLPSGALTDAARTLGVGETWSLPVPSYAGSVPPPPDGSEQAAEAIGQGQVQVSPAGMALVAAAIAAGTWRPPVLATDPAPTGLAPAHPLDPAVVAVLRMLMRGVVTSGTGTAANVPGPPVSGKTGTAEYGTDTPPKTHAWFIGFRGDLAFAVIVEGGGVGGEVAAPVAARFLRNLG